MPDAVGGTGLPPALCRSLVDGDSWIGFPLSDLIKRFEPTSKAKFVEFETLVDPETMPGVTSRFAIVDWPYREGLRIDEATHPLAFMAVGLYGSYLPAQNGAPMRLVVPGSMALKASNRLCALLSGNHAKYDLERSASE